MTDGRTNDGGDCNIPDAFLKKHGDNQHHGLHFNWQVLSPSWDYGTYDFCQLIITSTVWL